jgi:FkbM family methyltransferase
MVWRTIHRGLRFAANWLFPGSRKRNPKLAGTPMQCALEWLAKRPSFSIVQIGAHIGDTFNDPLCQFLHRQLHRDRADPTGDYKVILVEPVREHFEQLCTNYADLVGVQFENVAVAEEEGVRDLYRLAVDPKAHGYPEWLSQLGSFDPETPALKDGDQARRLRQFYLENQVVEKVNCVTLASLLDRHRIDRLDLLQLDTEGYDFEILKSIDFGKTRPTFINYERVLLDDAQNAACREMLTENGYLLMDWQYDTFCIRVE